MVCWDKSGDSFIIANTDRFVKLLPKYFKTKNYSSFVRQLNMYDFHKVKNPFGYHQFRHEKFKRGRIEDLKLIRRKMNVGDEADNPKADSKSIVVEFSRLKRSTTELEESLRTVASQQRQLIEANKDLVAHLYFYKTDTELKTRKLLFLFFILMNRFTPELLGAIKSTLAKDNIINEGEASNSAISLKNIGQFIKKISQRLIFGNEKEDFSLDKLMEIFTSYLKERETGNNIGPHYNWRDFVQNLLNDEAYDFHPGAEDTNFLPIGDALNDELNRHWHQRIDQLSDLDKEQIFGKDLPFEKDSILDMKSENLNDIDFLGNLSQRLASIKSIDESNANFLDNELNSSFNLKSPQSEHHSSFNF